MIFIQHNCTKGERATRSRGPIGESRYGTIANLYDAESIEWLEREKDVVIAP